MTPETVQQLLDRYLSEELSRDEFFALWQTLSQEAHRAQWEQMVDVVLQSGAYNDLADGQQQAMVLAGILREKEQAPVKKMPSKRFWWAAASVIVMLSVGGYLWFGPWKQMPASTQQITTSLDIPPGKEGAVLTLADGAQVALDSAGNGLIATQNGSRVVLKNNEITYAPGEKSSAQIVYNTLTTPNGRQFHVQLPDGTTVWLNAGSSIRYPTIFTGLERKVRITGEAYFEVAKDKTKPFIVDVDGKINIQVLGTQFNVNAYTDEPYIGTTLLEGSIRLASPAETPEKSGVILKPGQQARTTTPDTKVFENADLKMATAWKDGSFYFNYTPVKDILRQFARWYDVEVVYEQQVPDFVLSGTIKRNFSLIEALMLLEKMGLHYRIEGKKLIVFP